MSEIDGVSEARMTGDAVMVLYFQNIHLGILKWKQKEHIQYTLLVFFIWATKILSLTRGF